VGGISSGAASLGGRSGDGGAPPPPTSPESTESNVRLVERLRRITSSRAFSLRSCHELFGEQLVRDDGEGDLLCGAAAGLLGDNGTEAAAIVSLGGDLLRGDAAAVACLTATLSSLGEGDRTRENMLRLKLVEVRLASSLLPLLVMGAGCDDDDDDETSTLAAGGWFAVTFSDGCFNGGDGLYTPCTSRLASLRLERSRSSLTRSSCLCSAWTVRLANSSLNRKLRLEQTTDGEEAGSDVTE